MVKLNFAGYKIELINESVYSPGSVDNDFHYDLVYKDEETDFYRSTNHGVKIYRHEKIYKSAVICAVGGATGVHENSAVIIDEDILICCADKIFSLGLPNLELNWITQVDPATCFQIFQTENGIFVHGELAAGKIDKKGNIIWSVDFADILVTPEGGDSFIINKDFIAIEDWNHTKYRLNFDGRII